MAANLTITQIVDLIIKSGKLDSSALEKEFPKLINQAIAKLPGTKAVVSPDVKVDPKFDTSKVAKELRSILEHTQIAGKEGTKEFDHLSKLVEKYATALEKLSQVTTSTKFTPQFIKKAQLFAEGGVAPHLNTPAFQENLQKYRNYSSDLQGIVKQIQTQVVSTKDVLPNPEFAQSKALVKETRAEEKRLAKEVVADLKINKKANPELTDRYAKAQDVHTKAKEEHAALQAQGVQPAVKIGALIEPELERLRRALGATIGGIDKALKTSEASVTKQARETENLAKAIERVNKAVPAATTRAEFNKGFSGLDKNALLEAKAAISAEQALRKNLAAQGVTNAIDTPRSAILHTAELSANKAIKVLVESEARPEKDKEKKEAVVAAVKAAQDKVQSVVPAGLPREQQRKIVGELTRGEIKDLRSALTEQTRAERLLPSDQRTTHEIEVLRRDLDRANRQLNVRETQPEIAEKRAKQQRVDEVTARRATNTLSGFGIGKSITELESQFQSYTRSKLEQLKKAASKEVSTLLARPNSATDAKVQERLEHLTRINRAAAATLKTLSESEQAARVAANRLAQAPRPQPRTQAEADRVQQVERGRQAYQEVRGNLQDLPPSLHRDTRAFLQDRVVEETRTLNRTQQQFGIDAPATRRQQEVIHGLNSELHQLNQIATHTHPVLEKFGRVLGQFAKYAIGYGALYQVTAAFKSVADAVVDLEDKLKSIQAITGSTTGDMTQMAATIKQVATTSAFGIGDIADAVKVVVQAGTELKEVPKTVQAVSNLASASGTTLQTSADIITTAKSVWEEVSVTEIADRVTQAANVSKLAVEDLQTVFSLGASFAKSANINLDQYLGLIATLKNSGVKSSTIATGTSQFLTEISAPNENFGTYLSSRYKDVGENVSADDARKKFSSFRYEMDPILAALNELKRIGADSAKGLPGLERSVDRRAFRVLQPLLENINNLQTTSGRLLAAPSAQETAQVAMDSLKKATDNLVDQFHVLADTLSSSAIPAVTRLVKDMSSLVQKINDFATLAERNNKGEGNGLSIAAGTVAGAAAGFTRGSGAWKIGSGAIGAVAGGLGVKVADDISDINENGEAIKTAVNVGMIGYMLSRVKGISTFFSRLIAAPLAGEATTGAVAAVRGAAGGLLRGVVGKVTAWIGSLALLPLVPAAAEALVVGVLVTTAVTALGDIWRAANEFFKSEAEKAAEQATKRLDLSAKDLREVQAKELAEAESGQNERFDTGSPNRPPRSASIAGKVNAQVEARARLQETLGTAIGNPNITTEQESVYTSQLKELKDVPMAGPAREQKLLDIQKALGGQGPVDETMLQAAADASDRINSAIKGLVEETAKRYQELIEKRQNNTASPAELSELGTMRDIEHFNPAFSQILTGNAAGLPSKNVFDGLNAYAQLGAIRVGQPGNREDKSRSNIVETYQSAVRSGQKDQTIQENKDDYDTKLSDFRNQVRAAIQEFGVGFAKSITDALSVGGKAKPLGSFTDQELKAGIEEMVGTRQNPGRLIMQESGNNPNVTSPKGAYGVMQLMPSHFNPSKSAGYGTGILSRESTPEQQIDHGKTYLFGLAKAHPDWTVDELLAAYNSGVGNVEKKVPYKEETKNYIKTVRGGPLAASAAPELQTTDLQARSTLLDTVAQELLNTFEQDAAALARIQDAAVEQAKILSNSGRKEGSAQVSVTTQGGKTVSRTPLDIATELRDKSTSAIEARRPGGKEFDMVTALLTEKDPVKKQAIYTQLEPLLGNVGGVSDRISSGALIRNQETRQLEVNPAARVDRIADKYLQAEVVTPTKKEYVPNRDKAEQLTVLQERIDELKVNNPPELLKQGLLDKEKALQLEELQTQRNHIENNYYDDEELKQKKKESDLAENDAAQRTIRRQAEKKLLDLQYEVDKKRLESAEAALKLDIETLRNSESAKAEAGALTESSSKLASLESERVGVTKELLELKRKHAEVVDKEIAANLESQSVEAMRAKYQAKTNNLNTHAQQVASGELFYSADDAAKQTYAQAIGQAPPTADQARFAQYQVKEYSVNLVQTKQQLTELQHSLAKADETKPYFAELQREVRETELRFRDVSKAIAEAKARVEDYQPTNASEFSQISGQSIGARLDNLPQSLKNFNTNFENRVVNVVDSGLNDLTEAASTAADSLLGLKKNSEQVQQAWSAQQNAIGNQAQLTAQGSANLAEQITYIKDNETDPDRQQILIDRALASQAQAESIAQSQVSNATKQYNQAKYQDSFLGKSVSTVKDFVLGTATDLFKGNALDGFSKLFEGTSLSNLFNFAERGSTESKPLYVKNVEDIETKVEQSTKVANQAYSVFNKGGSTSTTSVDSSVSNTSNFGDSWAANLFGPQEPVAVSSDSVTSDPANQVADAVSTSVTDSLSSPWYSGFTESMSNGFDSLVTGLSDTFSSFTGALGVLLGVNSAPKKEDGVATAQKWVGLASSLVSFAGGIGGAIGGAAGGAAKSAGGLTGQGVKGFSGALNIPSFSKWSGMATGGLIEGPGTGTSDDIIATIDGKKPLKVSNGEYILNAKTVAAIGKDTLDAWNFSAERPAKFATGGMVGAVQSSVSAREPVPLTTNASLATSTPENNSVRVVLVDDQRKVKDYLTSAEGEKVMVDFVKRNSLSLKAVLR
jgi:TP901 family phage tail tape measure protein